MIGIFGGTFDPIHLGHLRTAWEVQQALALSQTRFIPCAIPPHRDSPAASQQQRLTMLQLAVAGIPGFVVDTRELDRGGRSYMVDTLTSMQQEFPQERLCLIVGLDAFGLFDTWRDYMQILQRAHLVVMSRPGFTPEQLQLRPAVYNLYRERITDSVAQLRTQSAGLIRMQTVTQLGISSTDIRRQRTLGNDVRFLVSEPVYNYIESEQLYRT